MKKLCLLFSAIVVLAACDNADSKKETTTAAVLNTDLLQQNLKGKVKSITETSIDIDSTGAEKPAAVTNYSEFDEKGYQTSGYSKDSSGKMVSEQFMTRNEAGMVTEFGTKKDGKLVSRVVTEISPEGKYLGGKKYDSTGKQDGYYKDLQQNEYTIVYSGKLYDMNNKLIETFNMNYDKAAYLGGKVTDSTGKTVFDGKATVNDKGDMASEEYTNVENGQSKTEKKTYTYEKYDDKGNWVERTVYNDKGKATSKTSRTITYYE